MAIDFDFTEDTAAPEVQDFEFQEEPAVPQLQFPTLPPGATLSDFLNQQPPIMQPWEGGVVRSALPGSLQPEDLLPAVRKIGGELAVGEQGDTHPDIIEREGIPAVEIDQRGFMGPQGEFYDREAAAQGTGLPTEREPGRLHSTDLPAFEQPLAITDKGPVYASQEEAQRYGTLSPSDLTALQRLRRTPAAESLLGPTPEELEAMGGAAGSRAGVVPTVAATMVALPIGLGGLPGKALMAYFTEEFIRQQPEVYRQAKDAYARGDWTTLRNIVAEDVLGGAMMGVGAKETFFPGKEAPVPPVIPTEAKVAEAVPPVDEPVTSAPEAKETLTPTIRLPDGRQFAGRSHGDIIIKIARETGDPSLLAEADKPQNKGFQNEKGEFLSRKDAVPVYKKLTGKDPGIADAVQSEDFVGHEDLMDLGEKPAEAPKAAAEPAAKVETKPAAPAAAPTTEPSATAAAPDFVAGVAALRPTDKAGGIRWDIRQGRVDGLKAKQLYRQVGSNEAVIEINGQRFVIDNIARLKGAGIETDYTTRKTTPTSVKTIWDWNTYISKYPRLGAEDFGAKGVEKIPGEGVTRLKPSIGAGIEAALRRKAEAGAVTVPAPIARAVEKTRDTITTLVKTKGVRDTMDYTKDVAGNAAMVYGQRVGNNIRGELRRAMGRTKKPNALDENALTFVREANGDRSQLGVMRSKLNASTVANPKWKNAALKAIDHADANWDRLNPIASQYEGATHAQIMAENNAGINTVERPGYVMHAQDVKNEFGFFSDVAGEGTTGFKHVRTHDTLADSIAAGVDPKSINAVTLLTQRVARGQMLINNRAWVEGLKATIDPLTRKTVITEPEVISRGQGLPPDTRAPEGYVMEIAGGRPIAILKPYAGIFRALTEPSKFSESLGWNMALKAATTGKSISLLIDTFHLGRIAFWESIIKPLSFTDPKLPLPSYKRGVLTLDYSPAELNRMAQSGEIDPAHLNDILQAQRDVNGLVKHGYNIAKISDMLHQEWMQKIPITGGFTKWLFNQFQRGAMAEVGALEVGRYRRMHPSWTEERVYREVAKDLNTRFGNLGRQGILKSRTAQDTARLLFLAPQWNEGLIRSELGAITGAVKGIASTAKEGRLSFGILPRAVGAMIVAQFAANQIINYITRGKPTWQNEEEGLGAKLSAWVPDVVGKGPGFFLHPLGLAAEVTHLLSQKYEKKGDAREAIMAFMGGRLSTLSRPLMTFLTRRDIFQRLIRPEKIWGETAKSAIPSPIGAQAVVPAIGERLGGEPKEPFVGAYQKQMMSSMGVKTDQAPSPGQRMQTLAQKFKKERGITTPGEFYGSAYTPLRDAIQRGAMKESLAEYDRLLDTVAPSGKRYTPEQIDNAMKPWTGGRLNKQTYQVTPRKAKTFTGSAAKEREFINTLTPEQKATYRRAYEDRVQFYKNFREMLKARPKATNEFGFVPLE